MILFYLYHFSQSILVPILSDKVSIREPVWPFLDLTVLSQGEKLIEGWPYQASPAETSSTLTSILLKFCKSCLNVGKHPYGDHTW